MFGSRLARRRMGQLVWLLAGAACTKGVEPNIQRCTTASDTVTLAVNQYAFLDQASASGCSLFPATTALGAEYLIVPQLTSGDTAIRAAYRLFGDTILPSAASSPASQVVAEPGAAERFHTFLRLGDERRSWGFAPERAPSPGPIPGPSATAQPPAYNDLRTFQVCATLTCARFDRVGARAKAINSTVAIFVDTLAPSGGLDSAALVGIAQLFEQRLYAIDTAAFGYESDIDSNSVVIVLMTNTVNKLTRPSECNQGFIAGFFFGADIDPDFRNDSRSNKSEVFYAIVADPGNTLGSCPHPVSDVQAFVPVTFIHEFQHMISYNQHVLLRGGNGEVLWLNEGLSHYAEELGGRSYEGNPDARIVDCAIGMSPCRFYGGNLRDAYQYLDSTSKHFLLPGSGIGTLAERGAMWLFVRYLLDQYAAGSTVADWDTLTRSLVRTNRTGAANIEAVTGAQFEDIVSRWALANWVTDFGGAPDSLRYLSWDLHAVYASLHAQRPSPTGPFPNAYPLNPTISAGRAVNLSGTLRSGSPIYHRATQPPGDPGFTLSFTAPSGGLINPAYKPRLNVIRLQ